MSEKKTCWLDAMSVSPRTGSGYPAPFAEAVAGRAKRALGDPLDLTQFGVNLVTLPPGAWSSQRHWHANEDEFVYVLEGEATLVTDTGETLLKPGTAAGFPAGIIWSIARTSRSSISRSARARQPKSLGTATST